MSIREKMMEMLKRDIGMYRTRQVLVNSILDDLRTEIERLKKRMDVGDIGADSISWPSGEIWTQEKREHYNQALTDVLERLK